MVQETIAHEQELTTTNWKSKLEEENKLEYVDHVNFEIVAILHKLFDNILWENKQFDEIQSELKRLLKLQIVNTLFNTNNFDKILKNPNLTNSVSFLYVYEVAQTKRGKKYTSKTKKIFLQFKTLAELPERVYENPQLYRFRVQQIAYLMQSNPMPCMQNFPCQDQDIFMWIAIYSLLMGISVQNKQYVLYFYCQKLLLSLLKNKVEWCRSEERKLFNILGYASLKSGIQKERERTFCQERFEMLNGCLGYSVLCDFYCAYISTYKSEIFIEGYVCILKTLLFHKSQLHCQFFSIENFDDGIVMYGMDTALGTYQDQENDENSIEITQKMKYEGEPHWEYVTHVPKQLPITLFTWITHNESVLASLGTPLLNVAMMMLRLTGLLLQKESQLTPQQVQDSFIAAYEWLKKDDSDQNIQGETSENCADIMRRDMLQWVYEKFYELGGMSLLIALNNYRTENFARKQTFDIDALKEYFVKEHDLLGEKGEDPFYEKFLSMILEEEYYGEEIRGEMLQRRFCLPEMIDQWLLWLEDFREKHTNFVQLWNSLPKSWENVSQDQFQKIYLSSTQLTEVWVRQPPGLPFIKEALEGLPEALFFSSAVGENFYDYKAQLLQQSARLLQIKMICEDESFRDISTDIQCILLMNETSQNVEVIEVSYLQQIADKLSYMPVQSPFTRLFWPELFYGFVSFEYFNQALNLLKMQKWQQDAQFLRYLQQILQGLFLGEDQENYLQQHRQVWFEICEQALLLKCSQIEEQEFVFYTTLHISQYFPRQQWETLFNKVVRNLGDLHPVVVELILKLAPDSVMDAALQHKSNEDIFKLVLCKLVIDSILQQEMHEIPLQINNAEEVHRVFKYIYAQQYLSGELLRQDVQEYHFTFVFDGDVVKRGLKSPILDVKMIKILLQMLEMCYQDSSERLPLLSKIVTCIDKNDVFTANMFEILTQYLTKWRLQQDQILRFLVAQYNGMQAQSSHILDDTFEQQLMACLKSKKHHMHAYNYIDILNENQAAQVRILIALFEDVHLEQSQLIQWATKLQSVVPHVCAQCDKLLSFLSVIDDSLDWITRYATQAQINQIIRSKSCEAKLKHELVEHSLQNNLLQQNSCDYLLRQQNIGQEITLKLLQYLHKKKFVVGMNALQNISQKFNFENIEMFGELDSCLVNVLIFASYQINKPQQALLIVDFIMKQNQHETCQFSFDWKGLSGYILALHQQNFDNTYIQSKIQPYLNPDMIFSDNNKLSLSEIPYNDLVTVLNIILDQQQNLYKQIFYCILNNSGLSMQYKVQVLLPKICFCLDEFDYEKEENICFVNQIFNYAIETNHDSKEILQQLFTILKFCPTWKFRNQSIFFLTQQLLNENNFRGINDIFQPQFLNFQQEIEIKQQLEIFKILVSKFQEDNFVTLSGDIKNFLLLFFNYFSLELVGDYLIQFCILLLNNSNENITFLQKLFNETFSGEIGDLEQLTLLIDKFSEMEVEPKLPESLILFLDENIEILTAQLRMKTLSYCTIVTARENSQICLHCYDILHSKYKHEITPRIWQAALVNATLLERYEKGFEILQHIPVERRKQEKQWEIQDSKLRSVEIVLEIKGGQDFERGWDLVTNLWNQSGVLPQKEIEILVEFLAKQQNPYTCGVILQKIFNSLKPLFLTMDEQFEFSFLLALTNAFTCSDNSTNKEENITHILFSFLNSQFKINQNEWQLSTFLNQCLFQNPNLLPVVVVISLSQKVEISNNMLDALDQNKNYQNLLNDWFKCKSILELMYDKSVEELQSATQKQEIQMFMNTYLKSLLNKQQGSVNLNIENGRQDIQSEEWRAYDKARWLSVLVEDGNWKGWHQDRLLACAQQVTGSKLKQYKQKKELIFIIEKEQNNILLGS